MSSDYPYLELVSPEGEEKTVWLKDILAAQTDLKRITIGRHSDNDLVLPDPNKKISRSHCYLEQKSGRWWVVDEGSQNGTFIQNRSGENELDVRTDSIAPLKDGSIILILGKLQDSTQPVFWKITFRDPDDTEVVQEYEPESILEYNITQEKLFWLTQEYREELKLRPKEKVIIHYMAQKNWEHQNQPVICRYSELIEAVWGDSFGHINNEITRLIWGIREKIESDSGEARFLKTEKGLGYRLEIKVVS